MITPHFPPDSTAGTHRVRLIAPHLPEFGWDPTVLTVDPRDYEGPLDPLLAESVPPSVQVVRSRAWSAQASRRFGIGDLGLRAFPGLRRDATRLFATHRFDAVFVTVYPTYPALLGRSLKKRFGVPFVLDLQDPWVGEWGRSVGGGHEGRVDWRSRASRFVAMRLEPLVVSAANAITAVSKLTYEQALARTRRASPAVTAELPIGWDAADRAFLSAHRAGPRRWAGDDLLHLVYVGTLLPTGVDTVRTLLAAVARLRGGTAGADRLRIHFFGTSNQRRAAARGRVLDIARQAGLGDIVTEVPERLDYFDALGVLADASAVLLLGSGEPHYAPSKVFPALISERPVIAVLHEASPAVALLRGAGTRPSVRLATYSDERPVTAQIDAIAEVLSDFLADSSYRGDAVDWSALEPASGRSLAGRLADVLTRTLSCAA